LNSNVEIDKNLTIDKEPMAKRYSNHTE